MEASGGSSGGGGSEELIAYEVASITEKLSQRGRFDVPGIQMQYPVLYEESMNTVRIPAFRGGFTSRRRFVSENQGGGLLVKLENGARETRPRDSGRRADAVAATSARRYGRAIAETHGSVRAQVLAQECIRYNKLVDVMELTLPQLDKALQGLVVMSGELEAMGTSMALGQVPGAWEAKAYPSLKPLGPWTDDLMLRLDFIRQWIAQGIPVTFWISGFYFPQAFLTGSMQNYARSHQFPIDTIGFDFIMLDTFSSDAITTKPQDGVYIRGLFLEGARWDPEIRSLNDSRPKQLFSPAPIMHLSPCKDRQEPSGGIYRCPIYKVLSRRGVLSTTGHSTNFVMWIEIPSNREDGINNDGKVDQLEWAKGGVAAFCSLKF